MIASTILVTFTLEYLLKKMILRINTRSRARNHKRWDCLTFSRRSHYKSRIIHKNKPDQEPKTTTTAETHTITCPASRSPSSTTINKSKKSTTKTTLTVITILQTIQDPSPQITKNLKTNNTKSSRKDTQAKYKWKTTPPTIPIKWIKTIIITISCKLMTLIRTVYFRWGRRLINSRSIIESK